MNTPEVNQLYATARRLVAHHERCQTLLQMVIDWADRGLYDPITDQYALRVPGDVIRSIRELLAPQPVDTKSKT